ncbi:MAG: glycoside hydrolase family 32 protein [Kiritimatiellae bacterium]|jgi:fructan beta-fructosidase|nr:glycoside hydrolase family 32 protein [Kiritimatiellia bacterium]
MYNEKLRPQFHFTAKSGWLNDPNGLLYHDGEYHMFYQFVPPGEIKGWGHAVSTDLLHWDDLGMAIPANNVYGETWSGSAVVDFDNVLGLQSGADKTLAAFFTGLSTWGQYMYVSTDKGRTWEPFQDEPVIPEIMPGNRDPKVFFHTESGKWILVLWCRAPENTEDAENHDGIYLFFASDDLVNWERRSSLGSFFECPDLFKLTVEDTDDEKWVLVDGKGDYLVGDFDGNAFVPETDIQKGDFGNNFYATQTWNNVGERIVQLVWMRNTETEDQERYPEMPFDQQMNFPCELSLKNCSDGIKVFRYPIDEIKELYSDDEPIDCADIIIKPSDKQREVTVSKGGITLCSLTGGTLKAFDKDLCCSMKEEVRILVDRVSVEIFVSEGEKVLSFCYLPINDDVLAVCSDGEVQVNALRSIWGSGLTSVR